MTVSGGAGGRRGTVSGLVLAVLFLAVAALLFVAVYYVLPGHDHFYGLIAIGILSLFFALGAYLAEAFSTQAPIQRAVSWAFAGMGFATLLLTLVFAPNSPLSFVSTIIGILLVLLVLIVAVAGTRWRVGQERGVAQRESQREAWRARPAPSAFTYATAHPPGEAPPPSSGPAPPPPGGN